MKRFTLLVDGYNFYFRCLWSCFKQGKSKILTSQKDKDAFEKKLLVDFSTMIKQLSPIINDVVLIEDSHSWRKDELLQNEYKGNRKKNAEKIDFDGFQEVITNFGETLSKLNIKNSQVNRAEGDDLIFCWSKYLFEQGKSSMILSTDRDLNQLLKCVNDVHIIQYAPLNNRLYVSKESNVALQAVADKKIVTGENLIDELFTISIENDPLKEFIKTVSIEEVNPEKLRFTKIISGDVSDNIFPVYYKSGVNGERSKGIGEKTCEKIYNEFVNKVGNFNYMIFKDDEVLKLLANIIYDVVKINDDAFTKRMLIDNIKTNFSIIALTEESIPLDVQNSMNMNIIEESNKDAIIISKLTRDNLFSNSKFKDYKKSIQFQATSLSGIKDDGDMSFITD